MGEFTREDDALLKALGIEVDMHRPNSRTPQEERIIAGFEEIQRFVMETGRLPQHREGHDVFERRYAMRLDSIRDLDEKEALLKPFDRFGLLDSLYQKQRRNLDNIDDETLLSELGVEAQMAEITELRHVRSSVEKRAAELIASRKVCDDFEQFKPLFQRVREDLDSGVRISSVIRKDAGFLKTEIKGGEYFIVSGQILYVAEVGNPFRAPNGEMDARLRVIYSNGTESGILLRSLQRAIYKDETSRRISEPNAGPLFSDTSEENDLASGMVYVLRSQAKHPIVAHNREILHKIGVTGGDVERRIANSSIDPTFLMATVEVVATYKLFNVRRSKLENLIHRVFDSARLDIEIHDRFGNPVRPREWFLVPLFIIDEAIERIRDGSIAEYSYDPERVALVSDGDES